MAYNVLYHMHAAHDVIACPSALLYTEHVRGLRGQNGFVPRTARVYQPDPLHEYERSLLLLLWKQASNAE